MPGHVEATDGMLSDGQRHRNDMNGRFHLFCHLLVTDMNYDSFKPPLHDLVCCACLTVNTENFPLKCHTVIFDAIGKHEQETDLATQDAENGHLKLIQMIMFVFT